MIKRITTVGLEFKLTNSMSFGDSVFLGAKLHNTELILLPKEETEAIGLISTSRIRIGILEDLNRLDEVTRANPPPSGADRP
jgi:hypothetical protein